MLSKLVATRAGLMVSMLSACGPTKSPVGGEGSAMRGSSGGASSSDPSASVTSAEGGNVTDGAGSADESDVSGAEPKYDIAQPDPPTGLCFELPEQCEPTWREDNTTEAWFDQERRVRVTGFVSNDAFDVLWGLNFQMECPAQAGAPKVEINRFVLPAQVTIAVPAKFEYTEIGTYDAEVDVEFGNACAHLLVHAIEVYPDPLPPGKSQYQWPDVPPTGWIYAHSQ